jgi:hypothetical protein
MIQVSLHRKLALIGALVATVSLGGAAMAANPPSSTHASSTGVTSVGTNESADDAGDNTSDAQGNDVSTAAQSDLTGGPHDNHGGYVSCIARGGSDCTSADQTLPSHGAASSHGQADSHKP